MNPFGTQTAIPSLFGEDPASQEARESYQAAGDVAQQLIGLQDPLSPEQRAEIGTPMGGPIPFSEAFLPFGAVPKGMQTIGGINKISRFAPSVKPKQLPAIRDDLNPSVISQNLPATRATQPSTFVRPTGPKRVEGAVINPLTTVPTPKSSVSPEVISGIVTGGLGGAVVADQLMKDPSQDQVAAAPEGVTEESITSATSRPKSPIEIHTEYLQFLKEQGVSDDERAKIAGQMLKPFLSEPTQTAQRGAGVDPRDEESSYEREQRRKQEEQDEVNRKQKYRSMARKMYGAKGGGVDIMAEKLMAEDDAKRAQEERAAAESEASIAASEALTEQRRAPKESTVEKDTRDIIARFNTLGIPVYKPDGSYTEEFKEALLAKGRISEKALGSGLLTDALAREFLEQAKGDKEEARRLAKEAGYTIS